MRKKRATEIYRIIRTAVTEKAFLEKIRKKKSDLLTYMEEDAWAETIAAMPEIEYLSCQAVLSLCEKTMGKLAKSVPDEGWLRYCYHFLIGKMYPHRQDLHLTSDEPNAVYFFLEVLRVFLAYEKEKLPFEKTREFQFATEEEIKGEPFEEQYLRFIACFREEYVHELMRIGREIMPFDSLAHVTGVHAVAMHMARQLSKTGLPLDLGLVSGAAAGHDIGKYGCKISEDKRIPYLHYYYTDVWFKTRDLADIGHVAANHSTWDLELENLPVESLLLIYADFRVKSKGFQNGKEEMGFFTLEEAFRVILHKLDNVDIAKEQRYRHVYSRLLDFENYMISLGVNIDLSKETLTAVSHKEDALLNTEETVAVCKEIAIEHNIRLMHLLSRESSFAAILETARSTRDWKNSRAYLNIFAEYFTYMTQKQKQMSLNFLYELMVHREGDIRRQAGDLLGNIISHYDVEYGKEIPVDVQLTPDEINGYEIWERYLNMIVVPDHKMVDRHRRWLGYGLKRVVSSLLEHSKEDARRSYIDSVMEYYKTMDWEDEVAFILLDTIVSMPQSLLTEKDALVLLGFMEAYASRQALEIRGAVLLTLKDWASFFNQTEGLQKKVSAILATILIQDNGSLQFLFCQIVEKYGLQKEMIGISGKYIFENTQGVSDIFLENLKAATPWKMKIINIELLYERIRLGLPMPKLHVAAHLSNLLKVSEQVTVRHTAGEILVRLASLLSRDERNEIAIELTKGLEIGEFEFSKYIPQYLGEFVMYLHPKELDEFLLDLKRLSSSTNDRIAGVALDTCGVMVRHYGEYSKRFPEDFSRHEERKKKILGMILKGFASYQQNVSREAFWVIGHELFGTADIMLEEKKDIFAFISKKLVTLREKGDTSELTFLNDTVGWNAVYRFIGEYLFVHTKFAFKEQKKVAFFPGTFDPFSLGHKEIAREIRNMDFVVYLALDEFSWSKKTQPHRIRRRILHMSVANEENIYLFPENVPVNIGNPMDLERLRELFPDKEVYMVAGSDVVENASSYRAEVTEHSIQTFPHILFLRESATGKGSNRESYTTIQNHVIELKLPTHFEDISSTRIRENIDHNRDISNLIDTVAQNYIYEKSLYLREPQYKLLLETKAVEVSHYTAKKAAAKIIQNNSVPSIAVEELLMAMAEKDSRMTVVFDKYGRGKPDGIMVYRPLETTDLFREFGSMETAGFIRENTSGKIVLFTAFYIAEKSKIADLEQILLTEALAECLRRDCTYGVFSPKGENRCRSYQEVLERQGFLSLERCGEREIYVVDMKSPVTLYHNVQTAIKEPFNSNTRVLETLQNAHSRFQRALTKLYPGELVISFDAGMMHNHLIKLITRANGVPKQSTGKRTLGPNMCVPFGKIMKGVVVPNTVTKVLHTEKIFDRAIQTFHIGEFPKYLPLDCQVRTIKSFQRPVILVDDLLHKGYRMQELDPLFKQENVEIDRIVVGILSGRGRDLMQIQKRQAESAYFIPSLRAWFVETTMYPFIGGDSMERESEAGFTTMDSVNLILPYVMPGFMREATKEAIYDLSMVCLQNTRDILRVLEEEYQRTYERSLTLNRLNEVLISPRYPDRGEGIRYDFHLPPSSYIANDLERLVRLKHLVK